MARNLLPFILIATFSAFVHGNDNVDVRERLNATFSQLSVQRVSASHIENLFEINTGTSIIYYAPQQELLFFGEIYDKHGRSITQESLNNATNTLRDSDDDADVAIGITGMTDSSVLEFISPQCSFCIKLDRYFSKTDIKLNRNIIFHVSNDALAQQQAVHVLCSDDPALAMKNVHRIDPIQLKQCDEGENLLKRHNEISQKYAINATPTLIFEDGSRLVGFDKDRLRRKMESFIQ